MKNRLLEDIDDSQSGPSAPAVRRLPRAAAAPPAERSLEPSLEPRPQPPPGPQAGPQPRPRTGVWRSRETLPPLQLADPVADESVPPAPAAPTGPPTAPVPPPRAAAGIPPWPASFSSREADWAAPPPAAPLPWTERWGRKALGWTIGLAGIVAVAGAASWMYRETQVQSTLAVVAGNTPGKAAIAPAPAPPATAALPATPEPAWTAPPLKVLPPPAASDPVAEAPVAVAPPVAEPPRAAPAPRQTPKARRAPERRVAAAPARKKPERRIAAAAPKKARAAPDLSWAERERERMLAQAANARATQRPAPPSAPPGQPAQQAGAEAPLSETLRLCRAAGYHAAACMKRGCEATRFGLVCRG